MKKSTDNRTMSFRRLLSLLLGLVLFMELLPGGLTVVGDASDAVTVTVDGARATQVTLPQSGRVTLEAASETGDTDYQWQIQLDGDWVNIYDATAEALTLTYAMVSPALENGSAMVRCAVGGESVSDAVKVTVSYDVEADSTDLNRQKEALAQETAVTQSQLRRASPRASRAASEYIEVSVNYLDAVSKLPIYTGFSATIKSGEPYTQTVLSPTYLGYAPYYSSKDPATTDPDAATESAQSLYLSIDKDYPEDTYTVNVYYKAIQVPYAVRYYFQDIHDDMYTENVGYYKQGSALTGTIVSNDDLALDADQTVGFTKLYHYPEAVAADGSTVFECYYDRNYYMLTLDADGGYGSEHVYARYGTPFVPITPTRHGYRFAGWDKLDENGKGDGVADVLPGTIPAENSSYIALWESADTTYTVVYWLKKPEANNKADSELTPNDLTYIASVTVDATAGQIVNPREGSGQTGIYSPELTEDTYICGSREHEENTDLHTDACKLGSTLRHYVYDNTDMAVEVKGDGSTVVNTVYKRREYTLRFYYGRARKDNGTVRYEVVGGSTYYFGNKDGVTYERPASNDDRSLLENVSSGWGEVEVTDGDMSSLISEEYKNNYKLGTLPEDGSYNDKSQKYYYLEFTAPYGEDITDLWPSEVFIKVPLTETERDKHTANKGTSNLENDGWGNYAYFAGWNGEYNVKYTQDNSNATIKCYYPLLDDTLLYDKDLIATYGDPDRVSFLGFFDNGANVQWSVPRAWHYKLYLPTLDNAPGDVERNGVNYTLYKTIEANDDSTDIKNQTAPSLPGFDAPSGTDRAGGKDEDSMPDGRDSHTVSYFYTRQKYTLSVQNHSQRDHTDVYYAASLDSYVEEETKSIIYPAELEPNAYTFDGWYTTSGHYKGTEYVPGSTMPAHNVALYAGWSPEHYTVKMFLTRADMEAYQTSGDDKLIYREQEVDHGSVVGEVVPPTDNWSGHSYSFNGWFYLRNGTKTAFTPTDTAVKDNLLVYADWGSHTAQPYLIHYVLEEKESDDTWAELLNKAALYHPEDGKAYTVSDGSESRTYIYSAGDSGYHQQIAADTRGYANQGTTRTFYPKAGDPYNQLYGSFNTGGYYPTLASHSITMEEESNVAAPTVNVFTFYYVHAANVSYTVEYRYHDTNELIGSTTADGTGKVEKSTNKAVVTERFAVVQDYVPDAFYKRLVLAVVKDEDGNYVGSKDNIITFYYTKNTQNAYYAIHYMLQNVDAATDEPELRSDGTYSNYTESNVHTEGIGEIGTILSVTPQQFSGFTMQQTAVVRGNGSPGKVTSNEGSFSFTVSEEGTELYVFYARNNQTYTTYYLRYGADVSDLTKLKKEDVLHDSKSGTGKYGAVVTETAESIDGYHCVSAVSQSIVLRPNNEQNYIIFYYEKLQYTVEYRVWTYGGGTLNKTIEVVEGTDSFEGSTPTAKSGYTFDGWYLDAECTISADDKGTVDENDKLTPARDKLLSVPQTNVFYARFKAVYGNVTITRTAMADESNGDQTYIYRLTAKDNSAYIVEVTVPAGGSTTVYDLPCGSYTVEQVNSWSWRYADVEQTVTVEDSQTKTVTFDKSAVKDKWLTGNSAAVVNRREK